MRYVTPFSGPNSSSIVAAHSEVVSASNVKVFSLARCQNNPIEAASETPNEPESSQSVMSVEPVLASSSQGLLDFQCAFCKRTFARSESVRKHLMKYHGIVEPEALAILQKTMQVDK